ncbi:MAG: protogloblin ApPgb [Mycobacterium sp.]|nr:MAG: protogloblin ApPgb [Mycobacterium sp.]
MTTIPGYTYDAANLPASPVSLDDLAELHQSVLWSDADRDALRRARAILIPQTDAILDVWYGFVGSNPHLVSTFIGATGEPDGDYLAAVRSRFGQWISDLCDRDHDAAWLAYQEEIALRHHTAKKNATDQVASPSPHVPMRHLIALIVPITATIRDFLTSGDASPDEVDAMYHAWFKAVTLSVVLWARPYSPDTW